MDRVMQTLKTKYATFTGRARRKEYWFFFLFYFIVLTAAAVIDGLLFADADTGPVQALALLALIVPAFAVGFRRLHDIDKSAWWLLIGLIPLLGALVLIYFYVQPGTIGSNRFGEDPKAGDEGASAPGLVERP